MRQLILITFILLCSCSRADESHDGKVRMIMRNSKMAAVLEVIGYQVNKNVWLPAEYTWYSETRVTIIANGIPFEKTLKNVLDQVNEKNMKNATYTEFYSYRIVEDNIFIDIKRVEVTDESQTPAP